MLIDNKLIQKHLDEQIEEMVKKTEESYKKISDTYKKQYLLRPDQKKFFVEHQEILDELNISINGSFTGTHQLKQNLLKYPPRIERLNNLYYLDELHKPIFNFMPQFFHCIFVFQTDPLQAQNNKLYVDIHAVAKNFMTNEIYYLPYRFDKSNGNLKIVIQINNLCNQVFISKNLLPSYEEKEVIFRIDKFNCESYLDCYIQPSKLNEMPENNFIRIDCSGEFFVRSDAKVKKPLGITHIETEKIIDAHERYLLKLKKLHAKYDLENYIMP